MHDYKFEIAWNRPSTVLAYVMHFWASLTPNFSMYRDWPVVLQKYNLYRSMWCGRFWQDHDVRVIPTINWSDVNSYEWAFLGVPKRQIVAIQVPDQRDPLSAILFKSGFDAMVDRIDPITIIVYGMLPFEHSRTICVKKDMYDF